MISKYKGPFTYSKQIIEGWNSTVGGVYYCLNSNNHVLYVGKATGEGGIRGRLLQHISETKWSDVVAFGYVEVSTERETLNHEANEIKRCQPKYNIQGL